MNVALVLLALLLSAPTALAQRVTPAVPSTSRPEGSASSPLARGVALLNARRPAEAVPLLEAALRADSLHEATFAALATAYLQSGRIRNAEAVARRGRRRFPASPDLGRLLAEALVGREALGEALNVYRSLEGRGGSAARLRMGTLERALGVQAAQAGRLDEAAAYLERAHALLPDSASVVRELAGVHLQRQAWSEARGVAESGLRRFRDDLFLMRARAIALTSLDDPPARLDALERLFRRDTTDVEVGLALAQTFVGNRRPQDAWTLLLHLAGSNPTDRRVFEAQAALASAALNPAAALLALRQVRRLVPEDASVLLRMGEASEGLYAWEEARAAYDTAAVLTGDAWGGRHHIARTYVRQDSLQAALVRYRDLVFAHPDSVALLREAAAVYEIAGRWPDVRRMYERIVPIYPADRWRLGRALERAGEPRAALEAYRQALADGAPHPFALLRLATHDTTGQACPLSIRGLRLAFDTAPSPSGHDTAALSEFQSRPDSTEAVTQHLFRLVTSRCMPGEARPVFEDLTRRAPLSLELRLAQSHFEAAAGDTTAALAVLERATRLSPLDANVQGTLGTLYEAAGRFTKAREAYERALVLAPTVPARYEDLARVMHQLGLLEALINRWRARLRTTPADVVLRQALAMALERGGYALEARQVREAL